MRTTIRQVAARANVSPMTVSHALNGRKRSMSVETYERVLQAAQELDYVPVRSAMQNRHVETRAIGLVPYHANFCQTNLDNLTNAGIYEGARKHGYDVLVMLRDEPEWMVNRRDVRFLDRRSDGFIFISGGEGEWQGALSLLVENNVPAVVCYRRDVPEEVAWVDPDNESAIESLLGCFKKHGHHRIAYLGAPLTHPLMASSDPNWIVSATAVHATYDDTQRRAIFNERTSADGWWQGCEVLTATTPDWNIRPEVLNEVLDAGITGVICCSDYVALQLVELARKAGLKIPRDLSIAGIDDLPEAGPSGLTTVGFGYANIGRVAVEAWIQLRSGTPATECCRVLETQLVERTSVTAPRAVPAVSGRK